MYKGYGKFIGLHTCGYVQYVFSFCKSAGSHKMCETGPVLHPHEIDEEDASSVVKLMTPTIISKYFNKRTTRYIKHMSPKS